MCWYWFIIGRVDGRELVWCDSVRPTITLDLVSTLERHNFPAMHLHRKQMSVTRRRRVLVQADRAIRLDTVVDTVAPEITRLIKHQESFVTDMALVCSRHRRSLHAVPS